MLSSQRFKRTERSIFLALVIWAIAVTVGGMFGIFTRLPLPGIALLVVASITTLLLLYYRHPAIHQYVTSLNPRSLVVFHLWRIGAGFAFLYYGCQALLPERFVINAGYGDLAVGFLVPLILLGRQSTRKYIAFHLLGLLDFAIAVGTGLTFTVLQIPLMENIATFPIVLVPLFGVPLTGATSVMAIDMLTRVQQKMSIAQMMPMNLCVVQINQTSEQN